VTPLLLESLDCMSYLPYLAGHDFREKLIILAFLDKCLRYCWWGFYCQRYRGCIHLPGRENHQEEAGAREAIVIR